jgi:serine/threonine protein kinase/WD40 repeat protein
MSISSDERSPVELLADEFLARCKHGEKPSIKEYCDQHPELAEEIRDVFEAVLMVEDLKPGTDEASGSFGDPVRLGGKRLEHIGDYRILRQIGRGGMGVVYEAEQQALGRRVALKVLPRALAGDGKALVRFQREARAAARMHHTNIVPVFDVGQDGEHVFYAMQLIQGQGLDLVLDDLKKLRAPSITTPPTDRPTANCGIARSLLTGHFAQDNLAEGDPRSSYETVALEESSPPSSAVLPGQSELSSVTSDRRAYYRSVAQIGLQTASALSYAHARGIIHRDIKPANLLLDAAGNVWVTDFGLAKTDDGGMTHTGDILGTLRYMSPERFRGQCDVRADVYALGLTLYEMLTLQPAYASSDRLKLIEQIRQTEPPSPRTVDARIPRDLDTIVVKAIDKDPRRRYQSADELVEDLQHFALDEPIKARRAGLAERFGRWCRRHPGVASLTGLAAILLVVIAVGGVTMSVWLDAALRRAERDRDMARTAQEDGQEKLLQSLISEAKASRHSRRTGQRFGTLAAIRQAVVLARKLEKPPEVFDELRNLAIAALALPDLRPAPEWISEPDEPGWHSHSPAIDGQFRRYAVGDFQGNVSVRSIGNAAGGTAEICRLPAPGKDEGAGWSADGRFLSLWCSPPDRLLIYRMDGDQPALVVEERHGHQGHNFLSDGRRLVSVSRDGLLRVYDLESGKVERSIPIPPGFTTMAVHPSQTQVAICYANAIRLVALDTGKEIARLPQGGGVLWHPSGQWLALVVGEQIEVWDVPRRRRNWVLEHRGGGLGIAFNASGDLLASNGWNGRVKLWNPHTGREVFATTGWGGGRFGPEDRLALPFPNAWKDHRGPLTQVEAGREYRTLVAGAGVGGLKDYDRCSLHPSGRLLAVGTHQGGVGLIDVTSGCERAVLPVHGPVVLFEPSGSLLTNGLSGLLRWPVELDPQVPQRVRIGPPERLAVPVAARLHLARSADGTVLAGGAWDGAYVWQRDRPREAIHLTPHTDCRYVSVSPDGALVATGSHNGTGLKVWNARDGKLVRDLLKDTLATIPLFSPDGQWLFDNHGNRWRAGDWAEAPRRFARGDNIACAPDMRLAAISQLGFILLVNPDTGKEIARLDDPQQDSHLSLTFNADGTLLFGSTNDSFCVHVWDLRRIRDGLKGLSLDWDGLPYPPAATAAATDVCPVPLEIEVVSAKK